MTSILRRQFFRKYGFNFRVGVIYNKPRNNKDFLEKSDCFLEQNSTFDTPAIICGDFNINVLEDNLITKIYQNAIEANGYYLSPNEPTRVTHSASTCIDHFVYQNIDLETTEVLKYEDLSDHFPFSLRSRIKTETKPPRPVSFRDTSFLKNPKAVSDLTSSLLQLLGELFDETGNVNDDFTLFANIFANVLDEVAPIINCSKSHKITTQLV